MFRKLILLLISSACCFSTAVLAVGLGESELKSGLNQPLRAEIKLLSVGDLSEHEVRATLASAAVFERVGAERPFFLNNIRFETVRENGELIIKLTTRDPIKEPFLNFLVELNSPKERVIREYTFLLDPPIFDDSSSSTIEKTQASQPAATQTQRPSPPPQQQYQQTEQPSYTGSTYGPVSANDTLWSIASRVRPSSDTSIHQTLVAIYRANPDAFANGNINNLLRGKVLQIPDEMTIAQVPHRAALQDVVMQNRQWQSGGARRIVDSGTDSASEQMSGDARLTLATPDSGESTSDANSGLADELQNTQQQLVRSQETSATLQAENDELRARLADVLKKLEGAQDSGAVNIDDTELAALAASQNQEETSSVGDYSQTEDTSTPDTDLETTDTGLTSTDDLQASTDDAAATEVESGVDSASDTTTSDAATTDTAEAQTSTTPSPTPQVYVPPQPEKSFLDELLESSLVLWGGAAAVLAIVLAVFWRMRKRMEEDDFQDDLVASAGAGTIDATESFELPDVGDDMLVELDMDDEDSEDVDSDEENFDPLGEADIYIAYGKYEQAESLLLEAIDDNPIRSDLKVKLMECYAENDDREKFESLAQEVSQAVDADEWQAQVNSLRDQAWSGQEAGGDNEFDLPSTEDIFGEDDDDFGLDEGETPALEDHSLDDEDSLDLGDDDDFSLDDDSEDEEFDIDMDMGMDDDEIAIDIEEDDDASTAVTETFDSIDDDEFALDDGDAEIDLDMDEVSGEADADVDMDMDTEGDADAIDIDDSDDISLDLDDDEFDFDDDDSEFDGDAVEDGGDEIATKLDLARAYIDMGDSDGAKEILSEVISEGTDAQKEEAQALLDKAD